MKLIEIVSRIRGFNVKQFGVTWEPPEPQVTVARRVLSFLEDRRVLYNPYFLEVADQCVHSIVEIRKFLSSEIGRLSPKSELSAHLRGIRAACRKFLDDIPQDRQRMHRHSMWDQFTPDFCTQLGELRALIGFRVAAIAVMYGLDVEDALASSLPKPDKDDA